MNRDKLNELLELAQIQIDLAMHGVNADKRADAIRRLERTVRRITARNRINTEGRQRLFEALSECVHDDESPELQIDVGSKEVLLHGKFSLRKLATKLFW